MTLRREYIEGLWERAIKTLSDAKMSFAFSSDASANRAYYAAFYAVSAFFAAEEKYFKKHTGIRAAVHKDLVKRGYWNESLGNDYDKLIELRSVADYGAFQHASPDEAAEAITRAERIIVSIHKLRPDIFPISSFIRNEENDNNKENK